ncbi:hypothetical protein HC031_26795 [Planosporangium thailandense]|uniref:Holin n=1 Tax=Planosporangium thailandense TaxID=765197 RepID=A0ABX0Y5C3_9ACTN|nr:hypothetical protein [Planosporangium thailandense]NJC73301.1 hypothetical protein [Planosporangium thailandense]
MKVGRVIGAAVGILVIAAGCGLTFWAAVHDKTISSVGIGGIFVVGVILTGVSLLDLRPSSLAFGKDGVTLQLVADAVKNVKDTAQQAATAVAADPTVKDAVACAKTEDDAEKIVGQITQRIVQALPATADLTRDALGVLRR